MTNNDNSLPQGSSSKKRKAPESSNGDEGDSDFNLARPKRSRTSRARVHSPSPGNGEPSSSAPQAPAGSSKKRKAREDDDTEFTEASATVKPPVKRARARMSQAARALAAAAQAGKGIFRLPPELHLKICKHLRPIDLLSLGRVSKELHDFLHGSSSHTIWRDARDANGIPDFASKLNITEQRFADLVFGESCHLCAKVLTSMKRIIMWIPGIAMCSACSKTSLVQYGEFDSKDIPYNLWSVIPHIVGAAHRRRYFVKGMVPDWIRKYEAQPDANAKQKWLNDKQAEQDSIRRVASECDEWCEDYKAQLAEDRMESVLNELQRRGWAQEIESIGSRSGERPIDQDKKLRAKCQSEISPSVLEKLIKHLLPLLEAERERRLEKERNVMMKHRLHLLQELRKSCVPELPANWPVPSSADIFMYPSVRQLIEDSPNNGKFTLEHLNSVKESFRETSKLWASEIKAKLFALLKGKTLSTGEDGLRDVNTVLNLATTFFSCSGCSYMRDSSSHIEATSSFRYKRAIMHACARSCRIGSEMEEPFRTLGRHLGILPWNHLNKISFYTHAYRFMREVITMCGLDPEKTTAKEMDALNPIFECLHCSSPFRGRCTMTWECGVNHHGRNGPHRHKVESGELLKNLRLVRLAESEAKLAQARMAEALARERARCKYDGLCCSVCKVAGNSVELADAKRHAACESENTQTNRKLILCVDRRQYPEECWIWPPTNVRELEIVPAFDPDSEDED
ncbi:hypothetical protein M413DRAFT_32575 [Hebeloma cylindrosporum]|uniref:F-box domain-containing protein n=1 Tax=Hebeloma cylindrosporum TaxID=76867 RepID=A0A0C2Y2J7_HEBCY|nr:hypothetical protein M413DRAFT_32575 [Hebeloma cylindrosporum h7]